MDTEDKKEIKSLFVEGHYHHPLPDFKKMNEQFYEKYCNKHLFDVNLNGDMQKSLLDDFCKFYQELPAWKDDRTEGLDYYYLGDNGMYSYSDAIFLYCMMRKFKPQRIIEIGAGHTTTVMTDVNRLYFENKISITSIEPDCDRIRKLLKENINSIQLHEQNVQDVSVALFKDLKENDILFIDSSHVSKFGSDVNRIIFDILPLLDKGVVIHFHDMFRNFEYPYDFIEMGIGWNENYLLHAFLMYNTHFQVLLLSSFIYEQYPEFLREKMPLTLKKAGGSLWLQKTKL